MIQNTEFQQLQESYWSQLLTERRISALNRKKFQGKQMYMALEFVRVVRLQKTQSQISNTRFSHARPSISPVGTLHFIDLYY